jgi:hypothetical protein
MGATGHEVPARMHASAGIGSSLHWRTSVWYKVPASAFNPWQCVSNPLGVLSIRYKMLNKRRKQQIIASLSNAVGSVHCYLFLSFLLLLNRQSSPGLLKEKVHNRLLWEKYYIYCCEESTQCKMRKMQMLLGKVIEHYFAWYSIQHIQQHADVFQNQTSEIWNSQKHTQKPRQWLQYNCIRRRENFKDVLLSITQTEQDHIHSSHHDKNAKKAIVTCLVSLGGLLDEVTRREAAQINSKCFAKFKNTGGCLVPV